MASENTGASEDLRLMDEDADSIVGGKKKTKKKVVAKKKAPVKSAVYTATSAVTVAPPRELTRDEMIAANQDSIDHSMEPLYDIPDLPSTDG